MPEIQTDWRIEFLKIRIPFDFGKPQRYDCCVNSELKRGISLRNLFCTENFDRVLLGSLIGRISSENNTDQTGNNK